MAYEATVFFLSTWIHWGNLPVGAAGRGIAREQRPVGHVLALPSKVPMQVVQQLSSDESLISVAEDARLKTESM